MSIPLSELVERTFAAVETMKIDAVMPFFADDAVLSDPHYPNPNMAGKAAIIDGLKWGFGSMQKMGFKLVNYFEADDHQKAAMEFDTAHVLANGMKLHFPQVFVVETSHGLITRLQAYEPYGPHGIAGVVLMITRLVRRLSGKR